MFRVSKRPIVGLDIGSSSVKMVSLRSNGDGYHVAAVARSEISADISDEAVGSAIQKCLKSIRKTIGRNCNFVLGLSGKGVKISGFDFTHIALEDVEQAVMFEAAQVCPFDIRNSIVDYQLIDCDGSDAEKRYKKKKEVHSSITGILAIAMNETIAKRKKIANDASLRCVMMDPHLIG